MKREELRDGYINVLRELYSSANFFKRMDSLYLDGGLGESKLRERQTRTHPIRQFFAVIEAIAISVYVFARLQLAITDRALRRDYRKMTLNVLRRRPNPFVIQAYTLKSMAQYHYHMLISGMYRDGHLVNMF